MWFTPEMSPTGSGIGSLGSPVIGTVWGSLGDIVLLEKVCHEERDFEN